MAFREISFPTEEEWLEFRAQGIGGSEAGAVMGINPWKSPLEVWLEKTGRAEPADLSGKESVEWGNRLESAVADKFSESHPELLVFPSYATYVSEERPWAHANVDRVLQNIKTGELGILEIKTAGARSDKDWVFGPPEHYVAQVLHYLTVTGYTFAHLAVLIGGQEYREYEIAPDPEDMEAVIKAVDTFWNGYVLTGTVPTLAGVGDEAKAIATLYPEPREEYASADDIDHPEIFERWQLSQDKKAIEARIKELDNEIKLLIGDKKGVETDSTRVTWVRGDSKRFDTKAFKKDNPDLYEKYEVAGVMDRGLRFSPAKE